MATQGPVPRDEVIRSQALAVLFNALGNSTVYGDDRGTEMPCTVIDDRSSIRQTHVFAELEDGEITRYRYTTNVTISVSRVPLSDS